MDRALTPKGVKGPNGFAITAEAYRHFPREADDELSRLLTFPNVLITSHQAFLTREALGEITRATTENLLALEAGTPFLAGARLGAQQE